MPGIVDRRFARNRRCSAYVKAAGGKIDKATLAGQPPV